MKQIKFRAWDKEEKKWLFGYEYPNLGGFSMFGEIMILGEYSNLLSSYFPNRLDNIEIMQFTGLHDKNGKEIYTGDILQGVGGVKFQVFDGKGGFSINTFQDELTTGYTSVNALADPQTLGYIEGNTEIIGNIYENQELIK